MITVPFGIAAGLAAAFFSSVSYLVSRHHGTRSSGGSRRLLVISHVLMGCLCAPVAVVLFPAEASPAVIVSRAVWLPCLISTGAYFAGTSCVFRLLTRADASRLSPLLGLKIVALALIVTLVMRQPLGSQQWLAVGLCTAAAIVLQRGGSGLPARSLGLLVVGCFCFAAADLGIVALIDGLQKQLPVSRLHAGTLAMTITYALGGLIVLPLAFAEARRRPLTFDDLRAGGQYAAAWLTAMVALYACIGAVGVVLSTILQSTRGLISVVIGAVLARRGWHALESRVDRSLFIQRVIAAVLMSAAIAVYVTAGR